MGHDRASSYGRSTMTGIPVRSFAEYGHKLLMSGEQVDVPTWQALDVKELPQGLTIELMNETVQVAIPNSIRDLQDHIGPNLPWSENQFLERVSGKPLNPGDTFKEWPWYKGNVEKHKGKNDPFVRETDWAYVAGVVMGEGTIDNSKGKPRLHIYQKDREFLLDIKRRIKVGRISERKQSSQLQVDSTICVLCITNKQEIVWVLHHILGYLSGEKYYKAQEGIKLYEERPDHGNELPLLQEPRFSHTYMTRYWPKGLGSGIENFWGDLNDVVTLLAKQPTTRQAYLPVFFPEDTGAVHGERVPCSLGYLFFMRNYKLHINYYIRSCDFIRHFRDDIYMTARLCQWMLDRQLAAADASHPVWADVVPGTLTMYIGSLHVFQGDLPKLEREYGTN